MKILVIRFSSIGDIVLTFPILRCIKEQLAESELHIATKTSFSELYNASGQVDKVHCLGDSLTSLADQLKQENFDVVIDLHNNLRSRIICFRLGVKRTYHFDKLNLLKWIYVRFKINRLPKKHIVDRYFETVENIGVFNDGKNNKFFILNKVNIEQELDLREGNFIAIAMGAQFSTKQIPLSKLVEIVSKIDIPIVLLGGKMDQEKSEKLVQKFPEKRIINTCGNYSLIESASILKNAKILLTGDTGLMHIASCFQFPIVTVWGNTTPSFGMSAYRPESNETIVDFEIQNLSCRPCSKIGFNKCPKGNFKCMELQDSEAISRRLVE